MLRSGYVKHSRNAAKNLEYTETAEYRVPASNKAN
jgi:hypothetical protein